jgi:predicted enzyme related to lactoylglutathione lyase
MQIIRLPKTSAQYAALRRRRPAALTPAMRLGIALFITTVISMGCVAPSATLPAITRRPNTQHHVGKVIWVDLTTPDIGAAERFYGGLFGWTFYSDPSDPGYVTAYLRDHLIGGIVKPSSALTSTHRSAWLTYLSVRDVDASSAIAQAHGARVLAMPHSYPNRGRQAVFMDPEGLVFAILASSTGDPPDNLVEPDRWIWSTALTRDVRIASAFYKATIGYRIEDLHDEQGLQQVELESDGYARATLNEIPSNGTAVHPRWINFVRVEDAADTVTKAVSLGGRILVSPHVDRHGGRLAVLADPAGAWFGVMEWPDGEHPKAAK